MIKLKFDHIKTAPYLDVEKNTSNSGFRLMFLDESSVEISNKKKTGGQNTLLLLFFFFFTNFFLKNLWLYLKKI